MHKKIILAVIGLLWVVVAVGVISSKQQILKTGKTVILETVPVDPRDFLRGDYAVLRYKISALDLKKVKSDKPQYGYGKSVYVEIAPRGTFWEALAVYEKKNALSGKVFIKGKVSSCYNQRLFVEYGIESYFVPEGEGKDIEKNMRGSKSSVSVEAVVDPAGNAMIKKVYVGE